MTKDRITFVWVVVASAAILIALSVALTVHNYRECRANGFGRIYCTTTHVLR